MTYIEREVLISHIAGVKSHLYGDSDWITGYRDGLQAACEVIQIFHAANTEPLKCGKWIEKVMVCPWDKDDVDVFEIVESYNFDDHDYESTYYFEGDDCNDGYLVVDSCTRCDKTIEWGATGHDREGVSHFFNKMGLCGGSAYEEVCTLYGHNKGKSALG